MTRSALFSGLHACQGNLPQPATISLMLAHYGQTDPRPVPLKAAPHHFFTWVPKALGPAISLSTLPLTPEKSLTNKNGPTSLHSKPEWRCGYVDSTTEALLQSSSEKLQIWSQKTLNSSLSSTKKLKSYMPSVSLRCGLIYLPKDKVTVCCIYLNMEMFEYPHVWVWNREQQLLRKRPSTTQELFHCQEVRGKKKWEQICTKITYSPTSEWRKNTKWWPFEDYKMELPILSREWSLER